MEKVKMLLFIVSFLVLNLHGIIYLSAQSNLPVILPAESGLLGADYEVITENGVTFVNLKTDRLQSRSPYDEARVISYEVTFPEMGEYNLFAKIRINPEDPKDDSFFYGYEFGSKNPKDSDDWLIANNLTDAGFANSMDLVHARGTETIGKWKWVNLSTNPFNCPGTTFKVDDSSLTNTFQIGGRDILLDIDKFAFGRKDLFFTVGNLDNVEAGSEDGPSKESFLPLAHNSEKFLGNIFNCSQFPEFTKYWNQVTPENDGKWGRVEPIRDEMKWQRLDQAYNLAKENKFPFRFHVLIWGNSQPVWIENLLPEEQLMEIEEWFSIISARYPDIDFIDVVNEPLHDPPNTPGNGGGNYIEALGGKGETGWDWVITAFELARKYFPNAKLMLNEFNILNNINIINAYLDIIELLKERDLIDAIGVQGHAFSTRVSRNVLLQNLSALAQSQLPIHITELDIDGLTSQEQLDDYKKIFPVLWEHPAVEGITLWGWKSGMWRTPQKAYLIYPEDIEPRPAFNWLKEFIESQITTSLDDEPSEDINDFRLSQNFPNPFNPTTQIEFTLPKSVHVTLRIYDLSGRLISTLLNENKNRGKHVVQFNASNLASGLYIYRIQAGDKVENRNMMLIK